MTIFCSVEEALEKQCEKLRELETATEFAKTKDALREEFCQMHAVVSQMYDDIEGMRQELDQMKEQNNQFRELLTLVVALDKKISHMEKNVPSKLVHDYHNTDISLSNNITWEEENTSQSQTIISTSNIKLETPAKDCKKILFNEPDICSMIPLISADEFNSIPKYIIGRQPLETVNSLIDTINQILKAKYTFLSLGKAHARKQGDLNLYLHYKKQDLDICNDNEYVYFFTAEDYERHTKSKLNKIKLNLITVLRHCKRLREHRVKNDLRYVILMKK